MVILIYEFNKCIYVLRDYNINLRKLGGYFSFLVYLIHRSTKVSGKHLHEPISDILIVTNESVA